MTTPTAPADDITLPALDPLREAERAKRVCTTLMRIGRYVDGLTVMERMRIGEAIGLVQRSVQLPNAAKGPIPFAGYDLNFAPGSNPENPQPENWQANALDLVQTIHLALERGYEASSILDENSPIRDRIRLIAKGRCAMSDAAPSPAAVDVGAAAPKGGQDEFDAWRQS